MNKTKLIYYCKEEGCNNEIHAHTALYGKGRCRFCAQKGKHHPMFGKKGKLCPNFKGDKAETRKKHYCIEPNCNNEICHATWKYGQGRCYSCANKGNNNAMFGVHRFGKEAPGYINGLGKEPYPLEFNRQLKDKIRKRDNYTCQKCRITEEEHLIVYGKFLSVHHIDYNKQNCQENNLITLCNECNIRVNFNRDYWEEKLNKNRLYTIVIIG